MNIGIRIKELRLNRKLSQTDLGKMIGVSKQAISMYERGERLPDIVTLIDLSCALNVDINFLLGMTNPPPGEVEKLTDGERMLLDLFRSAGPYQQELILRLLSAEITPKG